MLHHRVVPAIERQDYWPEMVAMSGARYPSLLLELFKAGDDFCIIEQDIESRSGTLDELRDCPEPWCFNAYALAMPFEETFIPYAPLGHTRFRAGLWDKVRALADDPQWLETWVSRDAYLGWHLLSQGMKPHRHSCDVMHHHAYRERHPSEDEWTRIQALPPTATDCLLIFQCDRCGTVLRRQERERTLHQPTTLPVAPTMCPICADDPSLWDDWRMDL